MGTQNIVWYLPCEKHAALEDQVLTSAGFANKVESAITKPASLDGITRAFFIRTKSSAFSSVTGPFLS
jgi:hypothetical protein